MIINTHTLPYPEIVTIAILVKDKAHTLPEYLACIEKQTWPKDKTNIYIRTNNNTDNSVEILKAWVERVKDQYLEVHFDCSDVPEQVQQYKQHEWNSIRFKVLGKIRQDSVQWAAERDTHYFVADCDNFIKPHTIQAMLDTQLPVVAPFLTRDFDTAYSNYHSHIDGNGYFDGNPMYYQIFYQEVKGLIAVAVVHCTYLIRSEYLKAVCYDDESYRYEYVIFSDCLRKAGVQQYLDNREIYGRITMAEDRQTFVEGPWYQEVVAY
jgi:hypothetical protein